MDTKKYDTIYETAKFYFNNKQAVHITLLSGRFYNGLIIKADKEKLVLNDEKFGVIILFYERFMDDGIVAREVKK